MAVDALIGSLADHFLGTAQWASQGDQEALPWEQRPVVSRLLARLAMINFHDPQNGLLPVAWW